MWQFARAVAGIGDACRALDIPVTGGNVSLYNETDGQAILPTPVLGVVGMIEDAGRGRRPHVPRGRGGDRAARSRGRHARRQRVPAGDARARPRPPPRAGPGSGAPAAATGRGSRGGRTPAFRARLLGRRLGRRAGRVRVRERRDRLGRAGAGKRAGGRRDGRAARRGGLADRGVGTGDGRGRGAGPGRVDGRAGAGAGPNRRRAPAVSGSTARRSSTWRSRRPSSAGRAGSPGTSRRRLPDGRVAGSRLWRTSSTTSAASSASTAARTRRR